MVIENPEFKIYLREDIGITVDANIPNIWNNSAMLSYRRNFSLVHIDGIVSDL